MLVPLIFILAMLGSIPGIPRDFAKDTYVYYTTDYRPGVAATACSRVLNSGRLCNHYRAEVHNRRVAIMFPYSWSNGVAIHKHNIRHEVEHLLRAEGLAPGSTYDEESVS